jgi:hypothetical protein
MYSLQVATNNAKVLAFKGKFPVISKINKIIIYKRKYFVSAL